MALRKCSWGSSYEPTPSELLITAAIVGVLKKVGINPEVVQATIAVGESLYIYLQDDYLYSTQEYESLEQPIGFSTTTYNIADPELIPKLILDIEVAETALTLSKLERTMLNIDPECEHELVEALEAYTDQDRPGYDEEFDKKIRALRPDWFDDVN